MACLSVSAVDDPLPDQLSVMEMSHWSKAEQALGLTLQGLANRKHAQVWVADDGMQAAILDDLHKAGTRLLSVASPWDVLPLFSPRPKGVLYRADNGGLPIAISLCAIHQAVAIEESLQADAAAHGVEIAIDARTWDDARLWREHQRDFARGIIVEQDPAKSGHLLDLAIARGAYTTYGRDDAAMTARVRDLGPDTIVYGWGSDEHQIITRVSVGGGTYAPADWSRNLSALQHLRITIPEPPAPLPLVPLHAGERVVAFVMSDGDNLQFLGGPFLTSAGHWGSPLRGQFTMTWEMQPLLATVAPRILAKLYAGAHRGAIMDDVITGPSGAGYCFPAALPSRQHFAEITATHLKASHLHLVSVLNSGGDLTQTSELLEQPDVLGVIYKDYESYNAKHGALWWHQGKPCLSYRFLLWEGLAGQNPEAVAAAIGELPASPLTDPASYILINVHAWSYRQNGGPMAAVQRTIALLPAQTRVVSATEMIMQMRQHFGTPVVQP